MHTARHRSGGCGRWRYQMWVGLFGSRWRTDQLGRKSQNERWFTSVDRRSTDAQENRQKLGSSVCMYICEARAGLPQVTAHKTALVVAALLLFFFLSTRKFVIFPFFLLLFQCRKAQLARERCKESVLMKTNHATRKPPQWKYSTHTDTHAQTHWHKTHTHNRSANEYWPSFFSFLLWIFL